MPRLLALLLIVAVSCAQAAHRPDEHERFDSPDAASRYDEARRSGTPDPQAAYAAARARMQSMDRHSTVEADLAGRAPIRTNDESTGSIGIWSFLGPGNIGGRTLSLSIDPARPSTMYAGAISGGVWKTLDGGANWFATGDQLVNLQVSSLAFDPRDSNTLYAGTGEGFFREEIRGTNLPLRGDGIFLTRNGGGSWIQLASTASNDDFRWVNDVVVSARDSQRIYAATRTGVWRSRDGGAKWQRVLATTVRGGCTDLTLRAGAAGDFLFAACGVFDQATVYRSIAAESNEAWTAVFSQPGMSRTSLAIAPSDPSIVYALAAGPDQTLLGVYRSDRNGDAGSWSARVTRSDPNVQNAVLLSNPYSPLCDRGPIDGVPMGWHCNVIVVDPLDPERVWAAGVDLFRSDDGGRNWGIASYWWDDETDPHYVHADQHAIVFDPAYDGAGNQRLFVASDGGVFRSDNARAATALGEGAGCDPARTSVNWTSLVHHYGATQFYHGAVSPDGRTFFGGAQDNGSDLGTIDGGTEKWTRPNGGDGGFVAIDPVNPRLLYGESQHGYLVRSMDGGVSFRPATAGLRDQFLFVTPFVLDPNAHDRLWTGGTKLWRSENGAVSWTAASLAPGGQITAIAVAPGHSERVFAGTTTGDVIRTSDALSANAATTWTRSTPRSGWVSSLSFDPFDVNLVYATYAGFGGAHVWKSSDGGVTWSAIDGTGNGQLPDVPVHSLAVDPTRPSRMYIGTDLGIFVTIDGGGRWQVENSGFANVITESVIIARGARGPAVYAFTHGRGAWRAELTGTPQRRRAAGR